MYELTIARKGRKAAPILSAEHGAMRKLPGGVRIAWEQAGNTAALTMDNAEAIRLYHVLGSLLLPRQAAA